MAAKQLENKSATITINLPNACKKGAFLVVGIVATILAIPLILTALLSCGRLLDSLLRWVLSATEHSGAADLADFGAFIGTGATAVGVVLVIRYVFFEMD